MRIENPLLAILRSAPGKSGPARPCGSLLTPGSLAEVLVAAQLERDRILLNIGSQELIAKNTAGLKTGQRILVRIMPEQTESGEAILQVLGPVPEESAAAARLRTVLSVKNSLGPVLKELQEIIKELPARPGSNLAKATGEVRSTLTQSLVRPDRALEASLRNLSSRLGLDHEARLAKAVGTDKAEKGPESGPPLPKGDLKPALLALAKELKPLLRHSILRPPEIPGLNRVVVELKEALALLKSGGKIGNPKNGTGGPLLKGEEKEQGPGRETRPAPAPAPGGPPLKTVLRLPRPAAPLPARNRRGSARGNEPEKELGRNMGRLKGAFIKKAIRVLERSGTQGSKKTTRPAPTLTRTEAARIVRAVWPRLAQSLSGSPGDPQALASELETALRGAALRLGNPSSAQTRVALAGVEEAVKGLEAVQLLNTVAVETNTSLVLPLPLAQAWEAESGQVFFYKPPHKPGAEEGDRPLRMVFLLDMTRLGAVRVDVSMAQKNLMINLYLAKTEAVERVSSKLDGLEKNLTEMGYNIRSLSARPVRTAPPLEEVAPQAAGNCPEGFIDIKA